MRYVICLVLGLALATVPVSAAGTDIMEEQKQSLELDELEQAALIRRSGETLEIADEERMRAMTRSINQ